MKNVEMYIDWLKMPVYFDFKCRQRFYSADMLSTINISAYEDSKLNDYDGNIFLISDHHFNHKNIIEFAKRPFSNLVDMESKLIEYHNLVVKDDDIVIFVGDFGFCNNTIGKQILKRLNGYKILVVGNHDIYHEKLKNFGYDEVFQSIDIDYQSHRLLITHYPIDYDYMIEHIGDDCFNIHGHFHKGGRDVLESPHHFNVNCEFINFTPIDINKIIEYKEALKC